MDVEWLLAEAEIRNLGYLFADAVNRNDTDAFGKLWDPEGAWIIDPPMNVSALGIENICELFDQLMSGWKFFHQIANQGPIVIEGDTASARMYMNEVGIFKDGRTHRNWSEYTDKYVKRSDRWQFQERHYHFLYVDGPPMTPDILNRAVEF